MTRPGSALDRDLRDIGVLSRQRILFRNKLHLVVLSRQRFLCHKRLLNAMLSRQSYSHVVTKNFKTWDFHVVTVPHAQQGWRADAGLARQENARDKELCRA